MTPNPATSQSLRPAIPAPTGTNYAPRKPLLELRAGTPKPESAFEELIQHKAKEKLEHNKRVFENMYSTGYEIANFIAGLQTGRQHPLYPGMWLSWAPAAGDQNAVRSVNLTRFWATTNMSKWIMSNPDIAALASRDTDEAMQNAEQADAVLGHYQPKFWTPTISQQECLQGLCWGTYVERFRFDDSRPSIMAQQPIYEQRVTQFGEGWGICADCGFQAEAQHFQQAQQTPEEVPMDLCPLCQRPADVTQPAQGVIPSHVGDEPMMLGDFVFELLPFVECRWDLSKSVQESSWFIHQRDVTVSALHRLLGDVEIPHAEDSDLGLKIARKLAWLRQGLGGKGGSDGVYSDDSNGERKTTAIEMSLGPDDIADDILDADTPTLGGGVIRKGPLINSFPDGFTTLGVERFKIVTGVYKTHHSTNTVSGTWHARAQSGVGQGFHDAIEPQKLFNTCNSQILDFNRSMATPALIVVADVLDGQDKQQYLGTPKMNIPVTLDQLGERDIDKLCAPAFPPMSAPSQFYEFTFKNVADLMQLTTGSTDMTGGALPGVNPRTKYGTQVQQANAHALMTPPLQVKGETRQALLERLLREYPKRFPIDRQFMLKGKYGRYVGKSFNGSSLRNDFPTLQVVKDSELPRNIVTEREDLQTFFAICGGLEGYAMFADKYPKRLQELEKKFNVRLDTEPIVEVNSLCLQRIRQMQKIAQMVDDPMILLLNIDPPVSKDEPSQELKAAVLSDWLDQDDAQHAPMSLRQAVEGLIEIHREGQGMGMMQQAWQQGQAQAAQTAPVQIAQMAGQAMGNAVNPPPPPEMGKGSPAAA